MQQASQLRAANKLVYTYVIALMHESYNDTCTSTNRHPTIVRSKSIFIKMLKCTCVGMTVPINNKTIKIQYAGKYSNDGMRNKKQVGRG